VRLHTVVVLWLLPSEELGGWCDTDTEEACSSRRQSEKNENAKLKFPRRSCDSVMRQRRASRSGVGAWISSSAELQRNRQRAQAGPLVSCVLGFAVLSREEQSSEVQCLLHVGQNCCPYATCAATNRRPLPSRCCKGRRWRGKRTLSVEMPSRLWE